ncbi:MAG: DUF1826 domain-containing protein [Ruegeria sp.]
MTVHRKIVDETAAAARIVDSPEGLSAIKKAGCAATIWQRQPLPRFQNWIDRLRTEELPRARVVLRPERVRNAMIDLVEACELPACDERSMLVDDIAALADIFARVMRAPYLRIRLDVITTNACRKFHIDAITARLICTYRGSGTQYGISTHGADPRNVRSVPTASPMVMRGTLWPADAQPGFVHRSPPIEGTGETRLVLVLDPVADLESDLGEKFLH